MFETPDGKTKVKQGYLFRRTANNVDKRKKYFVVQDGVLEETMVTIYLILKKYKKNII